MKPTNNDDMIDSRDVITTIDELKYTATPDEKDYLYSLFALVKEAEGSPDWEYGETLIRDTYFKDYAMQLADDIGAINRDSHWPNDYIDWDRAASDLQMDYTSVDFDGVEYWIRS